MRPILKLYTKMSMKSVRVNQVPGRVEYNEIIEGIYSIIKIDNLLEIIDIKSGFYMKITANRKVKCTIYGNEYSDNYLRATKNGDALVIKIRPTKGCGMTYKFYN